MADIDVKFSSADSSDREGETFEDAPDMNSRPQSQLSRNSTSSLPRSLIEGGPSSATSTPRTSTVLNPVGDHARNEPHISPSEEAAPKPSIFIRTRSTSPTADQSSESKLDEVHLGGDATDDRENEIANLPVRTTSPPKSSTKTRGLSGNLPSLPWGPSPASKGLDLKPSPAQSSKKLGMGFSWLSRKGSANVDTSASALSQEKSFAERRNTMASVAPLNANPELMLTKLDEGNDSDSSAGAQKPRNSLRDRFKMLRMREEAGVQSLDGQEGTSPAASGGALAGLVGRSPSVGLGIGSPTSVADETDEGLAASTSPLQSPDAVSPGASTSPDPNLAPGTASGMAAGPSAMADSTTSVDWDLWQAVVYEGPSAVARTSSEELSLAIASGIPSAIRGVVWQVLAQSKNEELENVYRELVVRGTDRDREMAASLQGHAPSQSTANGSLKEKQPVASSSSSIHSNKSTPATSTTNGVISPLPSISQEKDTESIAKLQSAMMAERKKKAQEDKAAIQKLEKVIKRDLGARTSYSKYAVAAGLQDGLFGVCKAYALFDEGVGYAQGMNFLVMPLLFNMPEEEAFCLLVRLMNQYHLRDMFIQDMPGLHLHLFQFERLLEDFEPALYCHLHRRNVSPQLYATQWFLTLFAYRFPLQLVLRIYDLILSEGLEGAILKFGLVLMQKNAVTLLGMTDMSSLTNFLKERLFDVYLDQAPSTNSLLESGFFGSSGGADKEIYRADALVQDACAIKITPEALKSYAIEWEEKQRVERDREAELELLRSANVTLSLKVRSLEERTEKSDAEHVQMASELVRTKVENQELIDKVESLKGQTEELTIMVDKQTEEVEQRLKGEMERIMQRNSEVQNENRGLEEQMAEMEKVLVETKMQFAEMNSEHESLKQKWTDLRKAIEA